MIITTYCHRLLYKTLSANSFIYRPDSFIQGNFAVMVQFLVVQSILDNMTVHCWSDTLKGTCTYRVLVSNGLLVSILHSVQYSSGESISSCPQIISPLDQFLDFSVSVLKDPLICVSITPYTECSEEQSESPIFLWVLTITTSPKNHSAKLDLQILPSFHLLNFSINFLKMVENRYCNTRHSYVPDISLTHAKAPSRIHAFCSATRHGRIFQTQWFIPQDKIIKFWEYNWRCTLFSAPILMQISWCYYCMYPTWFRTNKE